MYYITVHSDAPQSMHHIKHLRIITMASEVIVDYSIFLHFLRRLSRRVSAGIALGKFTLYAYAIDR